MGSSEKRAKMSLAGLAALAGLCLTPALARAETDLHFCNKTGAEIEIAIAYQDARSGDWTLRAWIKRKPGECSSAGPIKTGLFYYYAHKIGSDTVWPSKDSVEKNYCVPNSAVKRDMKSSTCAPGDNTHGFRGRVTETAKYTFSFS